MNKKITGLAAALLIAFGAHAADCDLHVQVVKPTAEMCGGDDAVATQLASRLLRALTADGVSADDNYGQLYITGRFDDIYKETVPGPPASTAVHTTLTLLVADIFGNKVFDSESFELRGVGTSNQRAYINALGQISGRNDAFKGFIRRANAKVISYFDANYRQLLNKAAAAAKMHDYDQALYWAGLIPECSKGYPSAHKAMIAYWQGYQDLEGTKLLNQARAAFAVSPNAEGAAEAYALLNQIEPASSAYPDAMKFAEDVRKQTKVEYDFEVHKKYEDSLETERRRIDAARQIGVAYGQGQKSTTTNILWK